MPTMALGVRWSGGHLATGRQRSCETSEPPEQPRLSEIFRGLEQRVAGCCDTLVTGRSSTTLSSWN